MSSGAVCAAVAGFYPLREVAELVNIGVLSAFVLICISVIVLRRARPDAARRFRAPFVPVTPLIGVGFSLWLLSKLPAVAWERFLIWLTLGLVVYFFYSRIHSRLAR